MSTQTTARQTAFKPPVAQAGDVVAVETMRDQWRFGVVRSCPGGVLLAYTPLGHANVVQNWIVRPETARYSVLITGDPIDAEHQARRIAFLDQAGTITSPITTVDVAALVDQCKPF